MQSLFEILEGHPEAVLHTLIVVLGYVFGLIVSYLKFGQELSFIKGQLSTILKSQGLITTLVEKSVIVDTKLAKVTKDMDRIFVRVKLLEELN